MRILFLTSRVPFPPDRGDRVRAFNLIRELSQDHQIDLATFSEEPTDESSRRELLRVCRRFEEIVLPRSSSLFRALRGVPSMEPLQVHYYRDRRFAALVCRMAEETQYGLVFSHLFRMYPYARLVEGAFRLLDLTDVISSEVAMSAAYRPVPMRWVYRVEGGRIQRYERRACRDADEVWVISEAEREVLESRGLAATAKVVPNGLDRELLDSAPVSTEPGRIGFLGHLEVFHNVDGLSYFCESIFPGIRAEIPEARFVIAGAGSSPIVNGLSRHEGVVLQGRAPDLSEFLRRTALFVAPLRFAAGTQNKAIQAMAAGVPTLVSPQVARGIGAQPGREIVLARSTEEWVRLAVEMLRDRERSRAIGEAGREFARDRFQWTVARDRLRAIERLRRP